MAEHNLIAQAQRGDEAAWETLVREHQEAAFRLAYLILGDPAAAEDAAQDAFIRAYRAIGRFDASRPLRPWLLSITANLARNRIRSAARYLGALQRLVRMQPAGVAGDPGPQANNLELSTTLWQAVRRLGQADQEVIYFRYFLAMSESETAQGINVRPGTVKSRLHRALRRLREVVDRDFPALREMVDL